MYTFMEVLGYDHETDLITAELNINGETELREIAADSFFNSVLQPHAVPDQDILALLQIALTEMASGLFATLQEMIGRCFVYYA